LVFDSSTSGFLVSKDDVCQRFIFEYTYIKPKITINRFDISLEGSIDEDLLTLYDKDGKKYLFIKMGKIN
jgi:hypothetical protein